MRLTSRGRFCHQEKIDPNICRTCVEDMERMAWRTERLGQLLGLADRFLFPSDYFRKLGETRRVTAVRDRLFNELMGSIFRNTISLGTGRSSSARPLPSHGSSNRLDSSFE